MFLKKIQVSKRFFQLVKGSLLCSPWLDQILTSIKGCNSVANLQKNDPIYLSIFLYVLTPEGDIRRVPGNQVLGVSLLLFFVSFLCNVSSVSSG